MHHKPIIEKRQDMIPQNLSIRARKHPAAFVANDNLVPEDGSCVENNQAVEGQFDDPVDGNGQFDDAPETQGEGVLLPPTSIRVHEMRRAPQSLTSFAPSNKVSADPIRSSKIHNISRDSLGLSGIALGNKTNKLLASKNPAVDMDPSRRPIATIPESEITAQDVLCGRGGRTNHHFGNKFFRTLVERARLHYAVASKNKSAIAYAVVAEVKARGGRFLKQDESTGLWEEISDRKASQKTSQALREGLANKKREALRNTSAPSTSDAMNRTDEDSVPMSMFKGASFGELDTRRQNTL